MTISSELMHAILAMDSYNRGYNAGIAGSEADLFDNMPFELATA